MKDCKSCNAVAELRLAVWKPTAQQLQIRDELLRKILLDPEAMEIID